MNEQEKLRVLIPHWIEHNEEHAKEFRRWAETAGAAVPEILAASDARARANESLAVARCIRAAVPSSLPLRVQSAKSRLTLL